MGYLALKGNTHLRAASRKLSLELLAREGLGTHWAKYPFSRCRSRRRKTERKASPVHGGGRAAVAGGRLKSRGLCKLQ